MHKLLQDELTALVSQQWSTCGVNIKRETAWDCWTHNNCKVHTVNCTHLHSCLERLDARSERETMEHIFAREQAAAGYEVSSGPTSGWLACTQLGSQWQQSVCKQVLQKIHSHWGKFLVEEAWLIYTKISFVYLSPKNDFRNIIALKRICSCCRLRGISSARRLVTWISQRKTILQ